MSDKPVTSRTATVALWWALRNSSDLMIPRYTPRDWWECDVWRLTKSGFVDEYEIKISVADFNADMGKSRELFDWGTRIRTVEKKHDLLAGSTRGPNRFWYVTTDEVAKRVTVPDYAGLMIVTPNGGAWAEKAAPRRHGQKWDGDRAKLLTSFYYRFWTHEAGSNSDLQPFGAEHDATLDPQPELPAELTTPALL